MTTVQGKNETSLMASGGRGAGAVQLEVQEAAATWRCSASGRRIWRRSSSEQFPPVLGAPTRSASKKERGGAATGGLDGAPLGPWDPDRGVGPQVPSPCQVWAKCQALSPPSRFRPPPLTSRTAARSLSVHQPHPKHTTTEREHGVAAGRASHTTAHPLDNARQFAPV